MLVLARIDWAAASGVAVALATLVLAWFTQRAVAASRRTADVAEAQLRVAERPLLLPVPPRRRKREPELVHFVDGSVADVEWHDEVLAAVDGAVGRLSVPLRNVGPGPAILTDFFVNIASEENFLWQEIESAASDEELDDPDFSAAAPVGPRLYTMGAWDVTQWTVPTGEVTRLSFLIVPDHIYWSNFSACVARGRGLALYLRYSDYSELQARWASFGIQRTTTGWRVTSAHDEGAALSDASVARIVDTVFTDDVEA